jgi:DNA adenine methylase
MSSSKRKMEDFFKKKTKQPKETSDIKTMLLVKNKTQSKLNIIKPILKWVGGKTQILDKLIGDFPVNIENYYEPFLGGGSVLFTLLSYARIGVINLTGSVYASDSNEPLIFMYKNIQTSHNELYDATQTLVKEYDECRTEGPLNRKPENLVEATNLKENYYYWIRSRYNSLSAEEKKTVQGSAFLIFLNKTCFRGVFRIGPNGFNVPYGHSKNTPEIINKAHLDDIHNLIKGVIFECCHFGTSLARVNNPLDYVYMDPPYAPENDKSFVGYTENGFCLEDHMTLFNTIHTLRERRVKLMMSNADVKLVRDAFTKPHYHTDTILCKRTINSTNPDAKAKEVIIKNY